MAGGLEAVNQGRGVTLGPLTPARLVGPQLSPESAEEYIEYLKSSDRLDEAAQRLATVVNDERFVSKAGKSNYQVGLQGDGDQAGGLLPLRPRLRPPRPAPCSCGTSCATSSRRIQTRCSPSTWTPSSAAASPVSLTSWASCGAHWLTTTSAVATSRRCLGPLALSVGQVFL